MSVCTTCQQTGIRNNEHDCPGIGDIQLTRQRGRGVIVDHAPQRALIGLHIIRDLAWPANIAGVGEPDLVNIADQVLYRVVGYDPASAALVVELVEDWRPDPAATVRALPERELHAAIREMARINPAWFQATAHIMDRIAEADNAAAVIGGGAGGGGAAEATACTPIPAATLMQLSEVPPGLRTERAEGQHASAVPHEEAP